MTELDQLDTVICLFVFWTVVLSLGNDIVKSVKMSENTPKYQYQNSPNRANSCS